MGLSAGARIGPYEIVSPLGAGGMGEVYRARDTRLERTVAIKVLNSSLTATPEQKGRFEREARVISQLQHPHICVLYDIGRHDGADYLVMEYLEGESLAERLRRGALPLPEVIKIGSAIAEALHVAHRAGVVHRDLKPGNIMLTKTGAKLLDFGLAKPLNAASSAVSGSSSPGHAPSFTAAPTLTSPSPLASPLTSQGAMLGTIQYMSPEQIEGKEADVRSDIFSFGAVLYEMATGQRAFGGKSQIKVASAILEDDPPPIRAIRAEISPGLEHVITTCLAKNPDERFQSAADIRLELRWTAETPFVTSTATAKGSRFGVAAWLATAVALLAIAAAFYFGRIALQPKPVLYATLLPPQDVSYHTGIGVPVLSPDGAKLAFIGADDKGTSMLYVRPMNSSDAVALPGTQGAMFPFWSPDSQSIGFFADKRLKRIDANGGLTQDLGEAPSPRGGDWSVKGVILYRSGADGLLKEVPAGGGAVSAASKLNADESGHGWPHFLPDGQHYLFSCTSLSSGGNVCLGDLDSAAHTILLKRTPVARYASGYVLYTRGQTLLAQPFDLDKFALMGNAVPITENVVLNPGWGTANFSASDSGDLVFQGGQYAASWPLTWYGRDGKSQGNLGQPARYLRPKISPDGKRVAVAEASSDLENDIWIFDTTRGTHTRFTFDGKSGGQVWAAGAADIIYIHDKRLYIKPSDNSKPGHSLTDIEAVAVSASPDGHYLAFMHHGERSDWDIWGMALDGNHKPFPVLQTPASEVIPSLSPNSKFLAFCSDESGSDQVYITAFPNAGAKWQVSTNGGCEARWRGDGKELFFADNGAIMAADITTTGDSVIVGAPHQLFRANMQTSGPIGSFDVSADGKKFLVNSTGTQVGGDALTLVTNWTSGLKK